MIHITHDIQISSYSSDLGGSGNPQSSAILSSLQVFAIYYLQLVHTSNRTDLQCSVECLLLATGRFVGE